MIREPSLKHLPSAIRNSYPGAMPQDKPQLVKLQNRHYRYSYHADNMVGVVSGQWNTLYFSAQIYCHQFTANVMFNES